jgi:hypothetical protein
MAALQKEITNVTQLLGAREGLGETEQSLAMETNIAAMAPVPRGKDESSLFVSGNKEAGVSF